VALEIGAPRVSPVTERELTAEVDMPSGRVVALIVVSALPTLAASGLGYVALRGIEGPSEHIASQELATQSLGGTEHLQTLAVAVLGLVGFLLSERLTPYWGLLSPTRRQLVGAGAVATVLSIVIGFIARLSVLSLSADSAVRAGLGVLIWLMGLQVLSLALGLLLIAMPAASLMLAGPRSR